MKWRFWLRQIPSQSDTCASLEPLLSLYGDGMASPDETRRVESHLGICEDCRRALSWMQATRLVISERPAALPPVDLRARIARAIAEAEPSPLSVRTARRPVALRPAVLAMAASLMVAGVVAEHSLFTAKRVTVAPPTSVASSPRPAAPMISRLPSVAASPKAARVAVVPPRRLPSTVNHLPSTKRPVETKMALVPDVSPRETPVAIAPAAKNDHPKPRVAPVVKPNLMAMQPKAAPHVDSIKPPTADKTTVEAMNPPRKPLYDQHEDVAAPSPELSTPPSAPVEVEQPKATRVAVAIPMPPPAAHEDVLSNVRARLPMFRAGAPDVKIYRDSSAYVQTAAYDSESKFVQAPINWTPTHLTAK